MTHVLIEADEYDTTVLFVGSYDECVAELHRIAEWFDAKYGIEDWHWNHKTSLDTTHCPNNKSVFEVHEITPFNYGR